MTVVLRPDWQDNIGAMEFEGVLKAYDDATVTIEFEDETEVTISRKDISMIRLAFIY